MDHTKSIRHAIIRDRTVTPEQLGKLLRSFPNAAGLGPVELYRNDSASFPVYWVVGPRKSLKRGEEGVLIREAIPLGAGFPVGLWGRVMWIQCHTNDPTHPWNKGNDEAGTHKCGLCGFPTWREVHGFAAGECERCGYHG
jgi:hypothetical protein